MPGHPDSNLDSRTPPRPCPTCAEPMIYTGLPDFSGPVYERVYKCPQHGYVRVGVDGEPLDGWG
ncbi:MAG: hypothetical protein ACI9KE_001090 [Polyangiales bacterium]|jgi:hypothetical protein